MKLQFLRENCGEQPFRYKSFYFSCVFWSPSRYLQKRRGFVSYELVC